MEDRDFLIDLALASVVAFAGMSMLFMWLLSV
jgi:hypothetical protein